MECSCLDGLVWANPKHLDSGHSGELLAQTKVWQLEPEQQGPEGQTPGHSSVGRPVHIQAHVQKQAGALYTKKRGSGAKDAAQPESPYLESPNEGLGCGSVVELLPRISQ